MTHDAQTDGDRTALSQGEAIDETHERQCRHCLEPIHARAAVCPHCSRHQHWLVNFYVEYLGQIGILASIVLVGIALVQLSEARRERITASTAAQVAEEAKSLNDFTMSVVRAENDDRSAFNQLSAWAKDDTFQFKEMAAAAVVSIRNEYSSVGEPGYLEIDWERQPDLSGLPFSKLRGVYRTQPLQYRPSLLIYIWKRSDISDEQKMELLCEVLKTDRSLTATYYAGKLVAEKSGLEWNPFWTKPLLRWCKDKGSRAEE